MLGAELVLVEVAAVVVVVFLVTFLVADL